MQREHVLDCQSERNCTRTSLRQDNIFTCVPGAPLTFTFSPRLTKGVEPFVYIAAFVTGVGGSAHSVPTLSSLALGFSPVNGQPIWAEAGREHFS